MASLWYGAGLLAIANQTLNWDSDDIRLLLVDETYTFDPDHSVSTIAGDELSGTGYARVALTTTAPSNDTTNDRISFDATDPSFTGINAGTINGAVIIKFSTNDAGSTPIMFVDGDNLVTNGGNVNVVFGSAGCGVISYAAA